jgi:hypothetical protein
MEKSDDVIISTQQANSFINSVTSGSSSNGDINYGSLINSSIPNLSNLTNSNANNNNSNSPNSSNNNSNSNSNNINNSNGERPPNAYTMPGILHFLQHEWNRFEYERQQWDTERAELLV